VAIDVIGVPAIPLRPFCETNRFRHMDRLEQYFRNRQDDHKQYDWDGCLRQVGGIDLFDPEPVAYPVAYGARRPNARYNLPKVIVSNLTQMTLAGSSFPEIQCEGDEPAQQALREWSKIMQLPARIAEARNFGGQQGTACWSLGVSQSRFRVDVHNPKHCSILEWADRANFIPKRVLKAYQFTRDKVDPESNSLKTFTFWYVRYWDQNSDTTWEEIPAEVAEQPDWASTVAPSYSYQHGWNLCPFYWVQNLCDSQEEDGEGDYEGIEDKFDEMNALLSSTSRGSRKNVDPTTVVRDVEPDDETLSKGSDAVIYAPNGAEYLEMKGTGATSALQVLDQLRLIALEEAQVVVPREDKITGAAQSAAAMRILYRPMIAKCNLLRGQYGPPIQRTLQDMLTVARVIRKRVTRVVDAAGAWLRDEQESVTPALDPGITDLVTLVWPPYFEPTAIDIKDAVTTAQAASGGKPVIAHATAVEYTARMFGVHDVDEELKAIEAEAQEQADRDAQAMEREAQAFAKPAAAANAAE
jgi:hypothetical protein